MAGGFHARLPEGHERFDVSSVGLVLVSKKETKSYKKAKELAKILIEEWNDCLLGNVYRFITTDPETGDHIDSCCGYYGDFEYSGILDEAKSSIDYYVKNYLQKAREKYYQKVIKEAKEKIKTAKTKLETA